MPIYEYRCDEGHTFEVMQRISDEPVEQCTTCERPVRRVFRPVAVHFKGSGFYNTDYGKRRRGGEAEGEAAASDGDASKDEPSSDAKGEKKSAGEAKPASPDGASASGTKAGSGSSSS